VKSAIARCFNRLSDLLSRIGGGLTGVERLRCRPNILFALCGGAGASHVRPRAAAAGNAVCRAWSKPSSASTAVTAPASTVSWPGKCSSFWRVHLGGRQLSFDRAAAVDAGHRLNPPIVVDLDARTDLRGNLEHTVPDLQAAQAGQTPLAAPAGKASAPFACGSLPEFVEVVIAPLYARHQQRGWCPNWWEHQEVRVRLHALWRAWESLRLNPSIGIARWLRDIADPQMDQLRDPDRGPFVTCGARHLQPPPCPSSPRLRGSGTAARVLPGLQSPPL